MTEHRPADPRAVLVRLTGSSAGLGLDPTVVAPGGDEGQPAQVDGETVEGNVRWVDAEHIVLVRPNGELADRALILAGPDPTGPGEPVRREIVIDGWRVEVSLESAARAALAARARRGRDEAGQHGPTEVRAIIPGVVVTVSVAAGDAVVAGQQLLVVEAMKMQNELRAPRDGTIERVDVAAGGTIEVGDRLLVIS